MKKKNVRQIGNRVDKHEVKKWVQRFQEKDPEATKAWFYEDRSIHELLEQRGCEGIWIFNATNDNDEHMIILYPADANGNILNSAIMAKGAAADTVEDPMISKITCPPVCPENF